MFGVARGLHSLRGSGRISGLYGKQNVHRSLFSSAINSTNESDTKKYFTYKRAIVGSLSRSVIDKSLKLSQPKEPIDYDKIIEQHNNYVNQLEKVLPGQVHRIPSDPQYPDQIFVEDPAVVAGGQVVLTKMAPETRKDEKGPMMNKLEELGVPYTELQDRSSSLDGGDVIFTGREFLIGLSSRTNQAGVDEFARIHSNWPVTGITVLEGSGVLHLKSMASMCGIDTIGIGDSEAGHIAWEEICSKARFKYNRVLFPDNNGANCLFINGVIFHPSQEDYPESYKVWQTFDCQKVSIPYSEIIKADGSLTCCSLLFN